MVVKSIGYRTKGAVMKKTKDLPDHVQIYDNLSKYMSVLACEARQLKRSHQICETWVYDGRVYVKSTAREKSVIVLSPDDLADVNHQRTRLCHSLVRLMAPCTPPIYER